MQKKQPSFNFYYYKLKTFSDRDPFFEIENIL